MFLYLYPAGQYHQRDIVIYDISVPGDPQTAWYGVIGGNGRRKGRHKGARYRCPPITRERELLKKSPRTKAQYNRELSCSYHIAN